MAMLTPPSPSHHSVEPMSPEDFRAMLAHAAENFTAEVEHQPEVYLREPEIEQILLALASPLKGKVVVVGPSRVGKTAVAQAAVRRIAQGRCPPELRGKEAWRLPLGNRNGLFGRGNPYALLDHLMTQWAHHPEIILFFDELTRSTRPGGHVALRYEEEDEEGGADPAALLALQGALRGNALDTASWLAGALKHHPGVMCLAEAEDNAWRRFSEAHPDYRQLFLPVRVGEPDLPTTRQIVRHAVEDLSILHGVAVTPEAIEQALDLSQHYALDRAQPGKTIDILRDALAVTQTGGAAQLTAEDVIRRFGEQSGLPRMLLDDSLAFDEAEVLRYFKQRVLAQDQAVEAIVQALSLLRARVNNPQRPMGVFLFLGPTGVGKTELARALAEYLYDDRDRLVRFNMADYAHPYQHIELFGNPHVRNLANRRGQLTNRLAGKAFSVIVLDEFEKAYPLIYQRFLHLFDEGLLINGNEETINLRNSIFIITSNFGARLIEQGQLGFAVRETLEAREKQVLSETEQYFTPEFMNRIDAVCVFHPLSRTVMADIARREIGDLLQREGLTRRQFEIDLADEVIEHAVALGYSPQYGARYLKRQIEKIITYPLAREINALPAGTSGGTIRLYMKHGRVASAYLPPAPAQPPPAVAAALPAPLTLTEVRETVPILAARVEALEALYRVSEARAEREAIIAEMADMSFWNNQATARRKLDAYQRASSTVELLSTLRESLDTLAEQCAAETPHYENLLRPYKFLLSELPRVEFTAWLSGPHDTSGAYLQITVKSKHHAARQWAATLAKMYLGWAKRRGLAANVLGEDQSPEGRTFTATLVISGFGVYGLLQGEAGAHRLVQTAKVAGQETLQRFSATVSVLPELDDDELPAVPPDLDVSAKTANRNGLLIPRLTSVVTIHHPRADRRLTLWGNLPSDDLVVEASRLLRIALHLEAGQSESRLAPPPGGVVRSYIRNTKDKGVHDHRTGQRTPRIKQVLEGEIQDFLDGALKQRGQK